MPWVIVVIPHTKISQFPYRHFKAGHFYNFFFRIKNIVNYVSPVHNQIRDFVMYLITEVNIPINLTYHYANYHFNLKYGETERCLDCTCVMCDHFYILYLL